jgi:hypothetical protein
MNGHLRVAQGTPVSDSRGFFVYGKQQICNFVKILNFIF